jgi:hypothetical protein
MRRSLVAYAPRDDGWVVILTSSFCEEESPQFIFSWKELEEGQFTSSTEKRRPLVAYAPRDDAETVMSNEVRHLLRLFFRWSWRSERRRPLAKTARGDTYWEGKKTPSQLTPNGKN